MLYNFFSDTSAAYEGSVPAGVPAEAMLLMSSVCMMPGATQLTRIWIMGNGGLLIRCWGRGGGGGGGFLDGIEMGME